MLIRFVKASRPYVVGDVAGFPDHIAMKFVDAGYAIKVRAARHAKAASAPVKRPAKAPKTK